MVHRLSVVAGSGGYSLAVVHGLLIAVPSLAEEHGLLGCMGSVVVAHGLSCSKSCGVFLDQGLNLCLIIVSCPLEGRAILI